MLRHSVMFTKLVKEATDCTLGLNAKKEEAIECLKKDVNQGCSKELQSYMKAFVQCQSSKQEVMNAIKENCSENVHSFKPGK